MKEAYQDPGHVASFGGVDALYRAALKNIQENDTELVRRGRCLHSSQASTSKISHESDHRVLDRSAMASRLDGFSQSMKFNRDYRYILVCVDILSKFAFLIPLKLERGEEVVHAFTTIFLKHKPKSLQTDQGKEFQNSKFQKFLKEHGVRFFTTFNNTKASIVERLNRTIRMKLWKYFSTHHTYRYIDVLDKMADSYNRTYHSSIKRSTIDVNPDNEREVCFTLYVDMENLQKKPCVFKVGDTVRVSKQKLTFEKGYETNWTEELFVVTECVARDPTVYRIKDLLDEPIQGTFYSQELQKVRPKEEFAIEKVLKKRTRKGRVEYQVKFKGYPSKFNKWIPSSNLLPL